MQWSDIPFDPTKRTLKQFGGLCTLFFGGFALWEEFVRHRNTAAIVLGVMAAAGGFFGLVWPMALRWVFVGWMIAVFPIGWVISRIVLGFMFYGAFTPIAMIFRLRKRDALHRLPQQTTTYWTEKTAPTDIKSYYRQF
jgi:hypothetical protein